MKKEWEEVISKYLNVEAIEINSKLLTAQNRSRLYWTNIKGIMKSILTSNNNENIKYLNWEA